MDNIDETFDDWFAKGKWKLKESKPEEGDWTYYMSKTYKGAPVVKVGWTVRVTGDFLKCLEWLILSGINEKRAAADGQLRDYKILEDMNNGFTLKKKTFVLPWPLHNRMWYIANKNVKTEDEYRSVLHSWPKPKGEKLPKKTLVMFGRGRHVGKRIEENVYRYEWVVQLDPKGIVPSSLMVFVAGYLTAGIKKLRKILLETDADFDKFKAYVETHGITDPFKWKK